MNKDLIRSLNLTGTSVLILEKGKDRVEYEVLTLQLIEEDVLDKGCNMGKTCFPALPEPCSSKVPEPPPPPPPPPPPLPPGGTDGGGEGNPDSDSPGSGEGGSGSSEE